MLTLLSLLVTHSRDLGSAQLVNWTILTWRSSLYSPLTFSLLQILLKLQELHQLNFKCQALLTFSVHILDRLVTTSQTANAEKCLRTWSVALKTIWLVQQMHAVTTLTASGEWLALSCDYLINILNAKLIVTLVEQIRL